MLMAPKNKESTAETQLAQSLHPGWGHGGSRRPATLGDHAGLLSPLSSCLSSDSISVGMVMQKRCRFGCWKCPKLRQLRRTLKLH